MTPSVLNMFLELDSFLKTNAKMILDMSCDAKLMLSAHDIDKQLLSLSSDLINVLNSEI